ncbi:MAG: ATP-binding protein [Dokdonella sp.]
MTHVLDKKAELSGAECLIETPVLDTADRSTPMEEGARLWANHPVVRWDQTFALPTPMLEIGSNIIAQSIASRRSGRGFYASPCYGKSTAIVYFTRQINDLYPNVSVLCLEATETLRPSELNLYADILEAAGFTLRMVKPFRERRSQVINLLWSLAAARGEYRIVLFVDEAQNLSVNEWSWLKTVQNLLFKQGVQLIVFPFGQEALLHERSALLNCRRDLARRFMRSLTKFEGMSTLEQLSTFLGVFDDEARYPAKGPSYSEFFFPHAYHTGWRLKDEAPHLWAALHPVRVQNREAQVSMECISIAIQYYLTEYSAQDAMGWCGSVDVWKAAVEASDYEFESGCSEAEPDSVAKP